MSADWLELARLNAPMLLLAAPLMAAALAVVAGSARLAWAAGCAAMLAALALAADMVWRTLILGEPLVMARNAIALRLDGVGAWTMLLLALTGALCVIAAGAHLRGPSGRSRATAPFEIALALCMIAGWTGAAAAQDMVGVFVGAQIGWLAGVGLVALGGERDRAALTGALRMLIAGGVGAALFLLGIALIGRGVGGLDLHALAGGRIAAPGLAGAGIGLSLTALALMAGIAPLHAWIGAAYGRAGPFAAMMLGAVGSIGALAALVRLSAYAAAAPAIAEGVSAAFLAIGLASVAIGSVQAVGASNLRRLAAYAAAAQAGCVLISVAMGSPAGFAAAMVQMTAQAGAALALFGAAAVLGPNAATSALDGFSRRAPLAGVAVTAGALSLMGAPLTLGFLGRWRLIEAGVGGGWWWAAGAVIVASLAAVFFGGRLIERVYFRRATTPTEASRDPWRFMLAPALLAAIAVTVWGVDAGLLLRAAAAGAGVLSGGAP